MDLHKRSVLVSGLPPSIQKADLRDIFDSIPGVEHIFISGSKEKKAPDGTALIVFDHEKSVAKAIAEKNDTTPHEGCILKVQAATTDMESTLVGCLRMSTPPVDPKSSDVSSIVQQLRQLDPTLLKEVMQQLAGTTSQASSSASSVPSSSSATKSFASSPTVNSPAVMEDSSWYSLKIPLFSGDGGKGEVTYPQWKYEIRCLRNTGRTMSSILIAIRRSLRGTAAEVLRYLGDRADLDKIMAKFDVTFGDILPPEQLLANFYSAEQDSGQNCTVWGCHLEHILNQLQEKGSFSASASQEMLRSKFWMGLREERIKNATRHRFESGATYEELVKAVRTLELEFAKKNPPKQHVQQTTSTDPMMEKLDKLLQEMSSTRTTLKTLEDRVAGLEQSKTNPESSKSSEPRSHPKKPNVTCTRCARRGHPVEKCHAKFHANGQALN